MTKNNQVHLTGTIIENFYKFHEMHEKVFYKATAAVIRRSGICDKIPLVVPNRFINPNMDYAGQTIQVIGQYRSCSLYLEGRHQLKLWVFVKQIEFFNSTIENNEISPQNQIYLEGHLCKAPVYRLTPLGRQITEMLMAVNRPYGKTDYIPCVCWADNAEQANDFGVGDCCALQGRIQSRDYQKKLPNGNVIINTAYEVSASQVEIVPAKRSVPKHNKTLLTV